MRVGIDLGGTKIEIVALGDDGCELVRRRIPTPQGDYTATVMAVAGLVESVENELGRRGSVGIGIPGSEGIAGGLVRNANSTCLIGKPLRRDLQALLQREVRAANDANCFALSEAIDGAGKGATVVFGVILGTGVGGASWLISERSLAPITLQGNGVTIHYRFPRGTRCLRQPVTVAGRTA